MLGGIFVKNTKTKKMVMIAILSALGMILNLIEIPYPLAPWLNLDLSEIVVLVAVSMMGLTPAIFVCLCKFLASILFKGPVGPIAIGQITALIASITICTMYYFLSKHLKLKKQWINYAVNMLLTMTIFAFVMYLINYLFVTPTYLVNKPIWYTQLPFNVDIMAFNKQYGSNMSVPSFLNFLSPYAQAIFIIYFPFNFIKGIMCAVVYSFVRPIEKNYSIK